MSSNSTQYGNALLNGLNSNILTTMDWLHTTEYDEFLEQAQKLNNNPTEEDIDKLLLFLTGSTLLTELTRQVEINKKNIGTYVKNSYNYGNRLALSNLNDAKRAVNTAPNKKSIGNLVRFNSRLVDKLNTNFNKAILASLVINSGAGIAKTTNDLLTLTRSSGVGKVLPFNLRCRMTGVTEDIRARNTGNLQAYVDNGVGSFDVVTAGDELVCDECADNEANNPYSYDEIGDVLQVHPNCRCRAKANLDSMNEVPSHYIIDLTGDVL